MKKITSKTFIPIVLSIIIFIALSIFYLSPLMEGKKLKQGDIVNHQGMSKEISDFRNATGDEALWTNRMFGGMPAFQISVLYKTNFISYIDKAIKLWLPHPAGLIFLYLLGFYILLLTLGVDKRLSIVGAIAFAFSSYFFIIIEAGHNSKANAIGYMAPVIAGIILCFRGRYILGGIITLLFLALEINANHIQITYYLMMMVLILGIIELIYALKEKQLKPFFKAVGVMFVALFIAFGANIGNLWTTYEYGKYSTRGKSELTSDKANKTTGLDRDYATDWSYGIPETFSLLIPNIQGGESSYINNDKDALKKVDPKYKEAVAGMSKYWGEQPFTSGPVYAGAIVVFLFMLGLFLVKGRMKWFLLITTVLSILLAWGKHFMPLTDFFFDFIPGYNKFRAVSMIMVIAEFTIPLLAILALKEIFEKPEIIKEKIKYFFISLSLTAGIAFLFWLTPSTFFSFVTENETTEINQQMNTYLQQSPESEVQIKEFFDNIIPNLEIARISIFKSDAIRSFLFIVLGALVVWVYSRKWINKTIFVLSLAGLITLDMFVVDKRYLNNDNFVSKTKMKSTFTPSKADELILKDKELNYRVLNLNNPFNDALTSYYHNSIGGYHGAKLKKYQELIEMRLSEEIKKLISAFSSKTIDTAFVSTFERIPVLNMLNTKYIIYNPEAIPIINDNALGNAWFVDQYKLVANADSEIVALKNFNPAETAIIDKRFENMVSAYKNPKDTASSINLVSYEPNKLEYRTKTTKEQLAVFSEIYYDKGWNVFVDGKKLPYFRANYVLRAMLIPAGDHTLVWKFEPASYYTGEKISLAFNILFILIILGGIYMEVKKIRNKESV
ncbi:MAG TPA: YfhO family protein [Bacteroidales bacterium]|nr:YfhO family protein [Bacteroidales bacterium]